MDDLLKIMVSDDEEGSQESKVSTLVFMDLEATGLPSLVGKKNVHITEISLVAIDRTDFENDSSLRVLNKLSLCIRPRAKISPVAMSITGLYNDVLDNQEKFDDSVPKLLEYFFRRLRRPLCLLAHNGKRYDFPLLQAELKNINYGLDPGILCADTLEAFRCISLNPSITQVNTTPCIPKIIKEIPNNVTIETAVPQKPFVDQETSNVSNNRHATNLDLTLLDEETDNLLSECMDLFRDIKEPEQINSNGKQGTLIGNISSSKIDPLIDERTPPKSKSQDELTNPKPIKRFKQSSVALPKDHYNNNVSTNYQHTQAKRQLFANGTSSNGTDSNSNVKPSRPMQFSLDKLYHYYFDEAPPKSHYAEADCIALSKVCQKVNKDFLKWIDDNSKSFSETAAMW